MASTTHNEGVKRGADLGYPPKPSMTHPPSVSFITHQPRIHSTGLKAMQPMPLLCTLCLGHTTWLLLDRRVLLTPFFFFAQLKLSFQVNPSFLLALHVSFHFRAPLDSSVPAPPPAAPWSLSSDNSAFSHTNSGVSSRVWLHMTRRVGMLLNVNQVGVASTLVWIWGKVVRHVQQAAATE